MTTIEKPFGCLIARVCPIHPGHEAIIRTMVSDCGTDCALMIGSCNNEISIRHFFSYEERKQLVHMVFPDLQIVGMPDYIGSDKEWMTHLNDILHFAEIDLPRVIFYGGCREDIEFFINAGCQTKIINRFDGSTPIISATQVRDALIEHRPVDGLLNPVIASTATDFFRKRWENFKRR